MNYVKCLLLLTLLLAFTLCGKNASTTTKAPKAKKAKVAPIPVYRYFNGQEHFYTTSIEEIGTATPGAVGNHGYTSEGIAFYALPPN
ncbi:hypothetical protein EKK58_03725 [Candidatus Dependentiae bacterium]|jgi:hypothetical protein|nr:MAG: hypothetical protein EKK58_03725 [Candidatus Dependentiae bacterium]